MEKYASGGSEIMSKDNLREMFIPFSEQKISDSSAIIVARRMRVILVDKGMDDSFVVENILPNMEVVVCQKFIDDEEFCSEILNLVGNVVFNMYKDVKEEFGTTFFINYIKNQNFKFHIPDYKD
jgi:hypothetical protein